MDFSLTEEQQAVRDAAAQVFAGHATVERLKAVEATDDGVDFALWAELARCNLLGLPIPEAQGGSGLGIVELCLLLEEQGRHVAPVPILPTLVGGLALAEFGSSVQRVTWLPGVVAGDVLLTTALAEPGANDPSHSSVRLLGAQGAWRLHGTKIAVPAAHVATRILVPASTGDGLLSMFIVDPHAAGVTIERAVVTNRELHSHVHLADVAVSPADLLGDAGGGSTVVDWILDRTLVGLCALQVGVAEEATRRAAAYSSVRQQFGKPLSTFQGVALKAADAYIDTEAMRVTLWQAAWRLSEGVDAALEVQVAKWWAAEAGQRVVHTAQHLHGGLGADVDYPIHRYFLWGKQIEVMLGGASQQLARIGEAIARQARHGLTLEVGA